MSVLPKHEEQTPALTEQLNTDEDQMQLPVEVQQVISPGAARILHYLHPEQFSAVEQTENGTESAEESSPVGIREKFDKPVRQEEAKPWYIKIAKPLLPKPQPFEPSPRITLRERLGEVEYPESKKPIEPVAETDVKINTLTVDTEKVAARSLISRLKQIKDKAKYAPLNLWLSRVGSVEESQPDTDPEARDTILTEEVEVNKGSRRKTIKRIGVAAVGLAVTSGVAYLAVKGMPHGVRPTLGAQELINPGHDAHQHVKAAVDSAPNPAPVKSNTGHLQQIAQHTHLGVNVQPGEGYTQVEAQVFPGKSAAQYYGAFKEAVHKFGPGFIKGVGHFKMRNGDYGLDTGKAHVSKAAYQFLSDYFKART